MSKFQHVHYWRFHYSKTLYNLYLFSLYSAVHLTGDAPSSSLYHLGLHYHLSLPALRLGLCARDNLYRVLTCALNQCLPLRTVHLEMENSDFRSKQREKDKIELKELRCIMNSL